MSRLSRRELVLSAGATSLGLLAACGRLPWQAQPPPKVARIGYLGPGDAFPPYFEGFRQGLREFGYVEGETLVLEVRWAEGRYERFPALAAELVQLQPDVILSQSTPSTQALQQATSTIPIVMTGISDPVGLGVVASLARPGGNFTGTSDLHLGLSAKRLELLKESAPGASRVMALWNPLSSATALDLRGMQDAGRVLGVDVLSLEVRSEDDLAGAFETVARERVDALIMTTDNLFSAGAPPEFLGLVAESRLPSMHFERSFVVAGGLMSYGPSRTALYRRAAYYVDRILKGTKPADLPVEQPMTFDFVVNMRTARSLGITFPNEIMLQVTEVIAQ